jgi:large subunit ribosomal protein L19
MSDNRLRNNSVVSAQLKTDLPEFKVGSIVSVHYLIKEADNKERVQIYKGLVTNRSGGTSIDATFTVARNSVNNVKVERTFPLHSPNVTKIVVDSLRRSRSSNLNQRALQTKDLAKTLKTKPVKVKTA